MTARERAGRIVVLVANILLMLLATGPTGVAGAANVIHCPNSTEYPTCVGTGKNDVMYGTNKADSIAGGHRGADTLYGRGGDDDLIGGVGPDKVYGGYGEDYITNQESDYPFGRDENHGGPGNDYIVGQINPEHHYGGRGNDFITDHQAAETQTCSAAVPGAMKSTTTRASIWLLTIARSCSLLGRLLQGPGLAPGKEGNRGPIRVLIEGFLRGRYGWYEGHRALWVLALPLLIGAFLVGGWLLVVPLLTIPRFTTEGPVVRNGVAAVVVCGKKSGPMNEKGMMAVSDHAPEPRTGGWWPARRGECTVWYHRPPGLEQRHNRYERAQEERAQ